MWDSFRPGQVLWRTEILRHGVKQRQHNIVPPVPLRAKSLPKEERWNVGRNAGTVRGRKAYSCPAPTGEGTGGT